MFKKRNRPDPQPFPLDIAQEISRLDQELEELKFNFRKKEKRRGRPSDESAFMKEFFALAAKGEVTREMSRYQIKQRLEANKKELPGLNVSENSTDKYLRRLENLFQLQETSGFLEVIRKRHKEFKDFFEMYYEEMDVLCNAIKALQKESEHLLSEKSHWSYPSHGSPSTSTIRKNGSLQKELLGKCASIMLMLQEAKDDYFNFFDQSFDNFLAKY